MIFNIKINLTYYFKHKIRIKYGKEVKPFYLNLMDSMHLLYVFYYKDHLLMILILIIADRYLN